MNSYDLFCDGVLIDVAINRAIPKVGDIISHGKSLYKVKTISRALNEPAKVNVIKIGG